MTALKYANEIRSAVPMPGHEPLHRHERFGKGCEDFYRRSSERQSVFMMFDKHTPPTVTAAGKNDGCAMLVNLKEMLSGEEVEIPADLVVLMVGMEAREDSAKVARLVNISRDKDGWFIESHPKLDPVSTTTDGVFIAGACSSPKDIPETVAQAARHHGPDPGEDQPGDDLGGAGLREIDEEKCSGCRMCNELCPYSAIEYDPVKKRSHIITSCARRAGRALRHARPARSRQDISRIADL
jgi:heterodisulfide reductase subunit A